MKRGERPLPGTRDRDVPSCLPRALFFRKTQRNPVSFGPSPLAWQGWEKVLPVKPNPPGIYKVCDSEAADCGVIWVKLQGQSTKDGTRNINMDLNPEGVGHLSCL